MRFAVTAVDSRRQVVALKLDAADEAAVAEVARQRGYPALLSIEQSSRLLPAKHGGRFQLLLFSVELLALLDAGLHVVEALQTLAEKAQAGESQRVVIGLLAALREGEPLSTAATRFPEAFSPLFVATLRSSERTGDLRHALSRFVAYANEFDKVRKKIVSALLYPAILLSVGTLVMTFLMFYVVPRFAAVYQDISTELPFFSRLLFAIGGWIGRHAVPLGALGVATLGGLLYALGSPGVRQSLGERTCAIPAIGERVRVFQLARAYRTIGMLLSAGIPAAKTLTLVSGLLSASLRPQLLRAESLLAEGTGISAALAQAGLTTPVAGRMLAVGERTGDMGAMMERIAGFLDDETARWVETFTRVLEPVLMAILGVAVGFVVVLMYMPIFELANAVR